MSNVPPSPSRPSPYRGRFAPSPTGPLHFGSLIAATGSYLDALSHQGEWLLRMEDIDSPRTLPGAADDILRTLEAFGFAWSGPVLYQQDRRDAYAEALDRLRKEGQVYACTCSRSEVAARSRQRALDGSWVYPGTCRKSQAPSDTAAAWRFCVHDREIVFDDRIQGPVRQELARDVGDFVVRRADGLFAYQLAVTVDDAFQGISAVVRGADLLASTPRQIALFDALGAAAPSYAHLPVATNPAGEKWSKQTLAPAIGDSLRARELCRALRFLGQPVPEALDSATLSDIWGWAKAHWSLAAIPRCQAISAPALAA